MSVKDAGAFVVLLAPGGDGVSTVDPSEEEKVQSSASHPILIEHGTHKRAVTEHRNRSRLISQLGCL
jgi:hypothetical protein